MNQTRIDTFDGKCTECGGKTIAEVEIYDNEYITILKKNFNVVQRLKAEILPLVERGITATDANCIGTANYLFREIQARITKTEGMIAENAPNRNSR